MTVTIYSFVRKNNQKIDPSFHLTVDSANQEKVNDQLCAQRAQGIMTTCCFTLTILVKYLQGSEYYYGVQ